MSIEAKKQEPVAWQWLNTAHFRKKLPKDAEKGAWNPLYTTPQPKHEQGYKDGYEAGWTKALNEAYSKREQEPVAWVNKERNTITWDKLYPDMDALYATPQRKPLTDDEIAELWLPIYASTPPSGIHEDGLMPWRLARAIEAAHGIKE